MHHHRARRTAPLEPVHGVLPPDPAAPGRPADPRTRRQPRPLPAHGGGGPAARPRVNGVQRARCSGARSHNGRAYEGNHSYGGIGEVRSRAVKVCRRFASSATEGPIVAHSPGRHHLSTLPSLTGVRFFACGTVVLAHVLAVSRIFGEAPLQRGLDALVPPAANAVTLFFVLSGFVLTWTAAPGDTARGFWRRRAARVLPNHVLTCTAAAVLVALHGVRAELGGGHGPWHPAAVVANLFLVHVWLPDGALILAAHPVTWSLACEALFYLLFPLLLRAVRRIRPARLPVWALATTAVTVGVPSVSLLLTGPPSDPQVPVSTLQFWAAHVFPVSRLPEFVLGMLAARLVAEGWRPPRLRYAVPALFLTVAAGLALPPVFVFGPLSAGPAGLLTAALAVRSLRAGPCWLERPWLVALGRRTYACYISHFVVIMYVRQYVTGPGTSFGVPAALGYAALMLVLSALATWPLYRFVERPAMARPAPPRTAATGIRVPAQRTPATDGPPVGLEKPCGGVSGAGEDDRHPGAGRLVHRRQGRGRSGQRDRRRRQQVGAQDAGPYRLQHRRIGVGRHAVAAQDLQLQRDHPVHRHRHGPGQQADLHMAAAPPQAADRSSTGRGSAERVE
ncbi:hypothetical protein C3486_34195 [Streptomyces sp. Ru73]|nr:hypothetical protein C3486_34195 [Streptomyces sp. Ru73]